MITKTGSMLAVLVLAGLLPLGVWRAQDQPEPAKSRSLELHLHALSRGYVRPLRATTDRVAAVAGIEKVQALGFGGDVLRFSIVTTLTDDAIASALGLKKIGANDGRVLLAASATDERVRRAEARAVLLDIAQAITTHPAPDWRRPSKALLGEAHTMAEQFRVLGLDAKLTEGVFYKAADYHIEEDHDRYNATYRLWAGKQWLPVVNNDDWGWSGEEEETARPIDARFVGLAINRSAWNESSSWVDSDGARLNTFEGDRSATDASGKLKVQDGANWLKQLAARAVAVRLRTPKVTKKDLPAGRGWGLFSRLNAENLQRWNNDPYSTNIVKMTWEVRAADQHFVARISAFYEGHPFYLEGEVDADAVLADYKQKGIGTSDVTEADLGDQFKWIIGPEAGPEVFQERRKEAATAMDALLLALGKLPADKPISGYLGKLAPNQAAELGVALQGKHFGPGDFVVTQQAFGDIEVSVGTPMTGGRWWLLGNLSTGKAIRSDR